MNRCRILPISTVPRRCLKIAAFSHEPIMSTERPSRHHRPRCRSLTGVRIVGTGSYVPDAVVTNEHLHKRLGFDSNWIVKRTGILESRHALPHQATSDLCYEAGRS